MACRGYSEIVYKMVHVWGSLHYLQSLIRYETKTRLNYSSAMNSSCEGFYNMNYRLTFTYFRNTSNTDKNENTYFLLSSYILRSVSVPSGQLIAFHKIWSCWVVGFSEELLHIRDSIFSRSIRSSSVNFFSSGAVPLSSFSLPRTQNQTFKIL